MQILGAIQTYQISSTKAQTQQSVYLCLSNFFRWFWWVPKFKTMAQWFFNFGIPKNYLKSFLKFKDNVIPVKIPKEFYLQIDLLILKFMEIQRVNNNYGKLEKKKKQQQSTNKAGCFTLQEMKTSLLQ